MAQKKDLAADRLYRLVGALHRQGLISRSAAQQYTDDIYVLVSAEEERQKRMIFRNKDIVIYERAKDMAKPNRS